ncbi:MAG: small conductance mechanosensitive ion channel, MscS family [Frankiales bacterium]|nr:small conductance mechanosensitive ion channel, MscS family [Frankiales bacterium]
MQPLLDACVRHADQPCLPLVHVAVPLAPVRIVGIIVVSLILRALIHHAINEVARHATAGLPNPLRPLPRRLRKRLQNAMPDTNARRGQRLAAVASVLRSIVTTIVFVVALVAVLSDLGINISGVVTVSSVAGVAIGFGAQTLVRDYLNGIAMLIEDQYGVGDVIDAGVAMGTVEELGLRVTRLRDEDGVIWHIRNGEIVRVANRSQGWGRAVVDVLIAYDANVADARRVLQAAAASALADEALADKVLDQPVVTGVERYDEKGAAVRVVVRTKPEHRDEVTRALREAMLSALSDAGIASPYAIVPPAPTGG